MNNWLPGETAPKNGPILVFGLPTKTKSVQYYQPGIHTAAWDEIDQAFCLTGGTWEGPFIDPIRWMPLPEPPKP